ncbi:MAG: hypothetical protein HYZ01_11885 [Ignavibacteriales bacterium]|nr:hypothetical protein [Ignavibacteriales bacterium]
MNSPSTFGLYETMRIVVPGFFFATMISFLYWCGATPFFPPLLLSGLPLIALFLVLVLVSGLTIYSKETTKKRKAFLENQPSLTIKTKARSMPDLPPIDEQEARRLYFFILNNHIPSPFHEKIFFFGTIYHIMTQVRRTSFWFAILSSLLLALQLASGQLLSDLQGLIAFTASVWAIYLLNVRYNKADRKMQENYQDQIFWLEMNDDLIETIIRKRFSKLPPNIS